ENAVDTMRAIKRALDPRNLMNPGKIFTIDA
ncbi:FAD-linked oxidase C-terminal domain-containing protein, partial [Burkholderia mallei]